MDLPDVGPSAAEEGGKSGTGGSSMEDVREEQLIGCSTRLATGPVSDVFN